MYILRDYLPPNLRLVGFIILPDYGAKEYGGTTIEDLQTLDKVVNVCRFGLRAQMGTTARATEWAELHDLLYNRPMEFEMMTLGGIHLSWPCFLER